MKKNVLLFAWLIAVAGSAQPYSIDWYKSGAAGATSAHGQFTLRGAIGRHDAAEAMSGGSYSLTGGFRSLISVVQGAGAPALTIGCLGNEISIAWPSASTGWTLQQNSTLNAATWAACGLTLSDDGTNKRIALKAPAGNLFFRLSHP